MCMGAERQRERESDLLGYIRGLLYHNNTMRESVEKNLSFYQSSNPPPPIYVDLLCTFVPTLAHEDTQILSNYNAEHQHMEG